MNKKTIIGNTTTIVTTIGMIFAGYCTGIAVSLGFQLPFTESQIADAITTIIFIIIAFYNAKYHNTFFNNNNNDPTIQVEVTTDDLQQAIQKAQKNLEEKEEAITTLQETETELTEPTTINNEDDQQ